MTRAGIVLGDGEHEKLGQSVFYVFRDASASCAMEVLAETHLCKLRMVFHSRFIQAVKCPNAKR